jgi:structural maintenance of chromosome 1
MDAISFVLGVRTTHLRGKQLRDLIHRGESANAPVRDTAFVRLVLGGRLKKSSKAEKESDNDSDDDNDDDSDDEQDDQEAETSFQRTISRRGRSEYRIDGEVVSKKIYGDALASLNVLVKARNFLVFQGDVESVASMSPKELTELIEQVSGSKELRADYNRLLEAKTRAEDETVYSFQKRKGIIAEERHAKAQSKEAMRYESLREQLESKAREKLLFELYHVRRDLDGARDQADAAGAELANTQRQHGVAERELRSLKKKQASAHKEQVKLARKVRSAQRRLDSEQPALIKLREERAHLERRIASAEADLAEVERSAEQHSDDVATLERELDAVRDAADEFERSASHERLRQLKLSDAQLADYAQAKREAATRTAALRQELAQLRRADDIDQEALAHNATRVRELRARREQLAAVAEQVAARRDTLQSYRDETELELADVRAELDEVASSNRVDDERSEQLLNALDDIQAQIHEAKADRRERQRDARLAEGLESLKRIFPSRVYGRIIDLAKPAQRRYQVPITVALGRQIDAIVVDTEATARECMQYLREQRIGSATFLPLDSIRVKPIGDALRQLGDGYRLAIDLMQFDRTYLRALQYVCGDMLVCDTLDEARRLCFGSSSSSSSSSRGSRYKVVTLDGTVIRKSGVITGGASASASSARRWDEHAVQLLKSKRDRMVSQLAELSKTPESSALESDLRQRIDDLERRIEFASTDVRLTDDKAGKARAELATLDAELSSLADETTRVEAERTRRAASIGDVERRVHSVEDELFAPFSAAVGGNIREFEERHTRFANEHAERALAFTEQQSRLRARLDYERHHDNRERAAALKRQLGDDAAQLDALDGRLAKSRKSIDAATAELAKLSERNVQLRKLVDEKDIEIDEMKKRMSQLLDSMGALQRQLTAHESLIDRMCAQRHALYEHCRVENVDLGVDFGERVQHLGLSQSQEPSQKKRPTKANKKSMRDDDSASDSDSDDDENESFSQSQSLSQQSQGQRLLYEDEDTIDVDFGSLPRVLKKRMSADERQELLDESAQQIEVFAAEMAKLAPNLKANSLLEEVQRRLEATESELSTARTAVDSKLSEFNKVKVECTRRFMRAFNHVAEHINAIYERLTRSSRMPTGGTASLSLEQVDVPFEHGVTYHAMPPHKRFCGMDQLSGGEKTVAALALLFAIHSYQPSPFFVLDEVDAALDARNVNRVARYIRSCAPNFQCIVISLKDSFFEQAHSLIGIYRDQLRECSDTLTLDLANRQFSK